MHISYMALNRMVEERAAEDEAYRRVLEQNGRPLLSHGRGMLDDVLLAKLRELGVDTDRQRLWELSANSISAQELSDLMIAQAEFTIPDSERDWVWIATTCLWERWWPQLPNMEMVDDKMQAGYVVRRERGNTKEVCRLWLETWQAVLDIMDRRRIPSLDEFDDHFGGTQSVFNWVQDLNIELHNAGIKDAQFFRERISLCETMLSRFSGGKLPTDNFKTALAESHFELGDREKGDHLFRGWLDEEPQWGLGWITWSDCYWVFATNENKDATRAEEILKEGLEVPGVRNRRKLLERLKLLY